MQIERQWKLLRLIPERRGRRSTDELWRTLRAQSGHEDVSKRTVERDLVFLQTMFPIEQSTEGRTNYWHWGAEVRMWLPGMTDDEALAFHMVESNMRDLLPEVSVDRLAAYFDSARRKLTDRSNGLRPWTGKFRVIASGVPRVARKLFNQKASRMVRQAVLEDKQICISYWDVKAERILTMQTVDAIINPLAIVQRDKELLLVFTRRGNCQPEFIALRDIESVSASLNDFEVPKQFDIDSYIESGALQPAADFPLPIGDWIQLSASFSKDVWERLCNSPLVASERIRHDSDDRTRLLMPIRFTAGLAEWLLSLGPKVKVHNPPSLRRWIRQNIEAAAQLYKGEAEREQPQHVYRWYERWNDREITCKLCRWHGKGHERELEPQGTANEISSEFRCPTCGNLLFTVDYGATRDEIVSNWDALDPWTRKAVLSTPERMEEFERSKLKSPKGLPDLKKGPDFLTWDLTRQKEGEIFNTVRHGTRLIWIQLALWEGAEEFLHIAEILRQRYKGVIKTIRITPAAMGYLGSDNADFLRPIGSACRMEHVPSHEN